MVRHGCRGVPAALRGFHSYLLETETMIITLDHVPYSVFDLGAYHLALVELDGSRVVFLEL